MSLQAEDREWTYEDYLALPDDGQRYEIIDGRLYVSPAPTTIHQTLSKRLQALLYDLERQDKGLVFDAPVELHMEGCRPVQPDLIFLVPDQVHQVDDKVIHGPVSLVVEILSRRTASRDRTVKLHRYARSGVSHYWMLDPFAQILEALKLDGDTYRLEASVGPGERFEPADFPGLVVDLDWLFAKLPGSGEAGE